MTKTIPEGFREIGKIATDWAEAMAEAFSEVTPALNAAAERAAERERVAVAVEAQIRHLRAVPSGVTEVSREGMAMDLQLLADDVRRGRYA